MVLRPVPKSPVPGEAVLAEQVAVMAQVQAHRLDPGAVRVELVQRHTVSAGAKKSPLPIS
jgi:hypothetical protein